MRTGWEAYLQSQDATQAEAWQLQQLHEISRRLDTATPMAVFVQLRAALNTAESIGLR